MQTPTTDREALIAAIDRFQLQRGTAVGSGILVSLSTLFPQEDFPINNFNSGGFGGYGGLAAATTFGERYGGAGAGRARPRPAPKKSMCRSSPAPTRMR